jgi:hypothetical protein
VNPGEDPAAAERAQVTADELRGRARSTFAAQVAGRPADVRRGQTLLATIPADPGHELALIWSPSDLPSKSVLFLRVFACGPDGERRSSSSSIRIGSGALAALAGALADALDLAGQQFRADRRFTRNQPPAVRAGGTPSTTAPAVTPREQSDHQDHDQHNGAA